MAASLLWLPNSSSDNLLLAQEVVRVSQEAADYQAWGWGLFMMAAALDQAGELDEAVTNLQRAIELAKGVPDHQVTVFASGILARCHLRQGNIEQAFTVLEESGQRIREYRLRGFSCVPVWISLAQAHLLAAEQTEGTTARADELRKAKQACQVALKQGKFDRLSLVTAFRMKGTYEWLRGETSKAQQWWQRSLEMAKGLHARYEEALTYLEMGQRMGKSPYLRLGAKFDLRQARNLE
jgi:tetratricopeptide (TPR) repeat protein